MKGNGRRDKTRRYIILTLYIVAVLFAVAAVVYEPNRAFYAAIAGYDMLFLVSYFVTSLAQNVPNSGKYMLLSFSVCLLFAVIIALLYLLFFSRMKEAKTEVTEVPPEEIRIPSAPQVMGTVWIMDDASPHLHDVSESEATPTDTDEEPVLVIPADDAEDTTLLTDDSQIKAEDTAIPEDSTLPESADFIDIPDVPVFTEAIIKTEEITADVVLVPPETEKISEVPSTPAFTEAILTLDKTTATVSLITFPDKPFMLEPIMEIGEAKIPSAPSIIEPNAIISEEAEPAITPEPVKETSNDDFFSGLSPEEADFWADFYIAGEDELELADGIYYMGVYANGAFLGSINTVIESSVVSISSSELLVYVSDLLTSDAIERIFSPGIEMLSLDYLEEKGVGTEFSSEEYSIYLTFTSEDMPVQILSIRENSDRFRARPVSDAIELDPAVFVLRSRYLLSADFDIYPFVRFEDSLRFRFDASNYARFHGIHFDFNYSMDFDLDSFDFDLNSYRFYTDLDDTGLRLSWGNINTDLFSQTGAIGIKLEKDASYASSAMKRRSQVERTIGIEKESDVQILNEGKQIFRKTLSPGNYRLTDFILYSGANRIEIIITPLDGSPEIRYEMDVNYLSSLLAPGEIYYSVALATSREASLLAPGVFDGGFRLPWLNNTSLEYDFRNITISGTVDAGLSPVLTMNLTAALQNKAEGVRGWNPAAELNLSFTHANFLGSTRYNLRVRENTEDGKWLYPYIYANIGQQITTKLPQLSMVSLGLTYTMSSDLEHEIRANASLSGRLGIFSWSAGISGGYDNNTVPWAVSGSLSVSPIRNVRVSLNARLDGIGLESPVFTGRAYVSWMFGKGSVTANSSMDDYMVSVSGYDNKNSFYASMTGSPMLEPEKYDANATYSYNGDFVGVSLGMNAYDFISADRRFTGSATLSTSSVFADGLVAFSNSIPEEFLIVRQDKALRGNEISIGVPSSSSTDFLPSQFGNVLYTGVTPGSDITVYSTSPDSFLNSSYYNLRIPMNEESGYIYRIKADELYSVSGIVVLPDGTPWLNGASPIYSYTEENGVSVLDATDYYLFTDSDGRFVVSGIPVGTYAFDVPYGDDWIAIIFDVESNLKRMADIQMLSAPSGYAINVPEPYISAMFMDNTGFISTGDFWELLYPSKEAVNE